MEAGGRLSELSQQTHPSYLRALVLEDDETDQFLIERVLVKGGVTQEVICFRYARHGLEYLRQANRTKFDLIVVDLGLPLMSGLEFLLAAAEEHQAEFEDAMVVILTSSQDAEDYNNASSLGLVELFLAKPFTPDHASELRTFDRESSSLTVSIAFN